MCGRTACTLAPQQLCQACSFPSGNRSTTKKFSLPQWKDHPGDYTYSPSTNVAPSKFTPVLIKNSVKDLAVKRYIDGSEKIKSKYIVQPMMWGLIPPFLKSDSPKGHGFKTNNCRVENIDTKKIYKPSLNKGQRCVVLCDGFYEWQSTKGNNKKTFFIHAPQPEKIEIWNKEHWQNDQLWSEEEGWKGAKLLKMAGLYSQWMSTEGEEIFSYSVITMESDEKFAWIHHRIPAILETDEDVEKWLEEENYKVAVSNLRNNVSLSYYPVSSRVNNTRNQDEGLFIPVTTEPKGPESASSKLMTAWLSSVSEKPKREKQKDEVKKQTKVEGPKGIEKWLKIEKTGNKLITEG